MPSTDEDTPRGLSGWVRRWWRALVSELLATAFLVWLGVSSVVPYKGKEAVVLSHPAFAFGFVVLGNAMAFGPTSGAHMNPAVTLAAALQGRMSPALAAAYTVAQVLGACAGFGALAAVTPASALGTDEGCTLPARDVSALAAAAVEAALTAVLAFACCGVWKAHDESGPDPMVPVKLGLVVAGLVFAGGHATGASLNPARSFAPALYHGIWQYHWVYWVGPLGGAGLAAVLHRVLLSPRAAPSRAAPSCAEEVPLEDKP